MRGSPESRGESLMPAGGGGGGGGEREEVLMFK